VTCRLVKAVSSYNFHASLSTHLRWHSWKY
jgi:hypothetical protein